MKKLSVFFVGLLSAVLIFSVAGVADQAAKTTGNITFSSVLDIDLTGDLTDQDVVQKSTGDNEFTLRNADESTTLQLGSVDMTVTAVTDFNVGVSYFAAKSDDESATEEGNIVNLAGAGTHNGIAFFDSTTNNAFGGYGGTDASLADSPIDSFNNVTPITGDFDTARSNNNLSGGGEDKSYNVSVDLADLTNQYTEDEELVIDVAFWVFDNSTA